MQEKAMVSDALNTLKSGLKTYTDMISQTENQQLRSTLQQMRNEAEQSQYELYTLAKNKNYYQPPSQASQNEINTLKSVFSGSTGWTKSQESSGSVMQEKKSGIGMSTTMEGNNSGMTSSKTTGTYGNRSSDNSVLTGSSMSGSSGGIGSIGL